MKRVVVVLALALVAAGCGGGLSHQAAIDLEQHVDAVRDAANAGSPESAAVAVSELRATVASLLDSGEIDDEKASEILAATDSVENALVLLPTTTLPDDDDGGNGNGNGKGKGKDKDKDDD